MLQGLDWYLPMFPDKLSVPSSCLALEDETDRLSGNVSKRLPIYALQHTARAKVQITHQCMSLFMSMTVPFIYKTTEMYIYSHVCVLLSCICIILYSHEDMV